MLKKIGLIIFYGIAGILSVLYLIVLIGSIYQLSVYPDTPAEVTLVKAVEMHNSNKPVFLFFEKPLYLTVTDAVWECSSIVQAGYRNKKHTDGVFTDNNNTAVVFVQIYGHHTCQELMSMQVAGELQIFTRRPVQYQSDNNGLITIDQNSKVMTLSLCTHCTPRQAWFYVIFFLAFPFIMWGIFWYGNRQQSLQRSNSVSK